MSTSVRGRITVHPRGFGFLMATTPEGEVSAFVTPPDLNALLDGDVVSAELLEQDNGRLQADAITLVERVRRELFGAVVTRNKRLFLKVDRVVANTDWPLEDGIEVAEGDFVVAEIRGSKAVPVRKTNAGADLGLERCVTRHGIRSAFPIEVLAAAAAVPKLEVGARRDLREMPTVTIDAPVSRDLDDAVAVLPAGSDGALRVLVSIADISELVPAGSPLDEEARLRGTSVYLAGRVIPMFPEALSNAAASLNPGEDRYALTVELRVDAEGETTSIDVYESVIRSHARLSYDDVAEFLAEGRSEGVPAAVEPTLRWLRTAAARLGAMRAARGGVALDREEAYVALDASTREPLAVEARGDTPAHRLIERLMVAANEAVASWLVARGLPGVYRVHDEPAADRVAQLARFAQNFGLEPGFSSRLSPRGLAAFEAQFAPLKIAPAIRNVLGRTLGPARYTIHPSIHYGLAAPLYLHFTSPIRRYADLAVHRVVKSFLRGERGFSGVADDLETTCLHLNRVAYSASKAETERHRMLIARLFATRVGERISGNVVSVKPFGLVVQMAGTGATGTIATDTLPDGPYDVDLGRQALVGAARRFAVGDPLKAVISGANEELGRVDLTLDATTS
jgi:ribonuclease R